MLFKFILFLSIYFLIKKVIVNFLSKIVLKKSINLFLSL